MDDDFSMSGVPGNPGGVPGFPMPDGPRFKRPKPNLDDRLLGGPTLNPSGPPPKVPPRQAEGVGTSQAPRPGVGAPDESGREIANRGMADILRTFERHSDEQRLKDRLESASQLEQNLPKLREYQDALGREDILQSRPKSAFYLRAALNAAKLSLDTAYDSLTREAIYNKELSGGQVLGTMVALQDRAWWDDLLRSHQLAADEGAMAAARDLAECISTLNPDDISPEDIKRLLANIDFLRKEITSAVRQTDGILSPGLVRQYTSAAYNVASQVMVGLLATSVTAEVSGAKVVPEVIYSAIGLTVASGTTEILRRASRRFKAHTVLTQFQTYHHELIEAIEDLGTFLSWLKGPGPVDDVALETVRSTCLAAGFLCSHVEQLALALTWPERSGYCGVLHEMRAVLDEVRHLSAEEHNGDIQRTQQKLHDEKIRLEEFSRTVDNLKPSHGVG
jgi:hypothetical protein